MTKTTGGSLLQTRSRYYRLQTKTQVLILLASEHYNRFDKISLNLNGFICSFSLLYDQQERHVCFNAHAPKSKP